ncbi:hypothetical protein B0J12DRAFT_636885 [Macrophomina phaseolina]|uniref:Hypervirulence associated protein TUDOR domain-containing protein n=1 Tax=Macrophomina phaseolina TaxID=35725 RepID=A0ABQ8GTX7_9PEZI|nr:hypothetical protein B0J12DRAFT_636885 [Macrophomina phaseolina]
MPSKDKYTNPDLRAQVKGEIHGSDKGGEKAAGSGEHEKDKEEVEEDGSAEEDDGTDEASEGDESADGEDEENDSSKGKRRSCPSKADSLAKKKPKKNRGASKQNSSKQTGNCQKGKKSNSTVGSSHKADTPAEQGSNARLPEQGQQVHWKAMPGWVDGEVVEIVNEQKKAEGKQVKASEGDPRIVLRSSSS